MIGVIEFEVKEKQGDFGFPRQCIRIGYLSRTESDFSILYRICEVNFVVFTNNYSDAIIENLEILKTHNIVKLNIVVFEDNERISEELDINWVKVDDIIVYGEPEANVSKSRL